MVLTMSRIINPLGEKNERYSREDFEAGTDIKLPHL
jgi:hypothetical protein